MLGKLLRGESTQVPPELPLAFSLAGERRLRIQKDYQPVDAWRFLSHHIRRHPQDLRAHTQRILLAQHESLLDRLPGSLQDAFLALDNAGQLLRQRLLELVGEDLSPEDKTFFTEWMKQDTTPAAGSQWRKGSLLTTGQDHVTARLLHIERSQETSQYTDVMEEVFACLEYGQIDTARELLEAEMLAGNTNENMEQELVNIYQYTRDREKLNAMVKHLEEAGHEVSALWREKQQESEHW
ncbi:MAG TPA: hypothetical protein PLE99_08185 [Candidatus Thiothrix moscowensis]|uniref:hypothetical protein n=1 Tax=unclassified Thiothrix TaxID=2636184 RepID=UPI001A28BB95|nr:MULTISPECIES: hypothetical protein [unclassified Thiothrix]MBJ6610509.1 hypothetical protein [Candidatus Thiothrix moscowensis]HRJ52732.1 hypothetical protein [Candidatus Thiothrix moscowensis]HRJ92784.1 hypothetical protein [Candidatus Thiothrix moscowensis]